MNKVYIKDQQDNKVLPYTHVSAVLDDEGNDLGSHLGAFEDEVRGLVETPHQEYVTVATYSALPASGSEDTIYRVSSWDGSANSGVGAVDVTVYSEYAWNGSDYVFLCVKSQIDEVFDITVYNSNTKYADLSAALGVNGVNIPESLRKGGMSVKYVQTYDNNYVQYRLMTTSFSTIESDWQREDKDIAIKNIVPDLAITDEEGNATVIFEDGQVKTKNFDSSKTSKIEDYEVIDLGIFDDNKNCLVQLKGGHIKTKNFDSSKVGTESKDSIYGDLGIFDESKNCIVQFKGGHIRTKNFDSSKDIISIDDIKQTFLQEDNRINTVLDNNPLGIVKETAGLSAIIQNWGFIGDSFMSGVPHDSVVPEEDLVPMPRGRNFYKYSWGQMMCRMTGAFGTNYSAGGGTTKGWLSTYPGNTVDRYNSDGTWPVSFSEQPKIAYAINLGTNDDDYMETLYPNGVGNLSNVHVNSEDYTESDLNTYAGCFGKILSLCKEVSPSSRIFVITTPSIESNVLIDIINIQRSIVNSNIFTHIYLIDLREYMKSTTIQNIYGNSHLFCQGYMYYAFCVMTYIDYIIREHPSDFKNIAYIEYLKNDTGQI